MEMIARSKTRVSLLLALTALLSLLPMTLLAEEAEEIAVTLDIPRLLSQDILVRYDGQTVYLPFIEIFTLLEFNVQSDLSGRRIYGFIMSKKDDYEIDLDKMTATVRGKTTYLRQSDFYSGDLDLYLRLDLFTTLFDLKLSFDFAKMSVLLPLNKEFPAFQRLLRKQAHDKLQAKTVALGDIHELPKKWEPFSGAVADWMLSSTPIGTRSSHDYNMTIGGMVLGGDFDVTGGGDSRSGFDSKQLRYQWHYYFGRNQFLTQAELGYVFAGGTLARSLKGAMVTNRPQIRRKYFQTVDLTGTLGEGWEVELYIDNKLADFAQTDQNGEYHFNVDIIYGSTLITLKMYGPNGEFQTREEQVRVPYTLIPKGELEYTAASGWGTTRDDSGLYAQAACLYGILSRLTAGVTADYPLDVQVNPEPTIAGELAFQPLSSLTAGGYFAPGYAAYGGVNFNRFTFLNLNSGYTRYFSSRFRNRIGQTDNITFSASAPLRFGRRNLGLRLYLTHDRFPNYTFTNVTYGLSTTLLRVNLNYIGGYKLSQYEFSTAPSRVMTSELLISPQFVRWLKPQLRVNYDHEQNAVTRYGVYLNKRVLKTGQISLSYERNELSRSNLFMASFNLYAGFLSLTTRAIASSRQVAVTQAQRGSIRYDQAAKTVRLDHRNGVGFGSAVVRPYMDNNYNGVRDGDDGYIKGLRAKIQGANGRPVGGDRLFFYDHLRPYDDYLVEIDPNSLDNPLLKPSHENFQVNVNPNMITTIDVPIVTAGEINGQVQRQTPYGAAGSGGIKIIVTEMRRGLKTEITTFNSGEFYYLGLVPGKYRAEIDPDQLIRYGYASEPIFRDFEVLATEGGAVVGDVNFLLIPAREQIPTPPDQK